MCVLSHRTRAACADSVDSRLKHSSWSQWSPHRTGSADMRSWLLGIAFRVPETLELRYSKIN